MTPERWQRVKEIFRLALDRESSQRSAFLNEACKEDPSLRMEVESLLTAHAQADDFIVAPAWETVSWSPDESPINRPAGQRIGSYQILHEIGQGGMGVVYLASRADDQFQKRVAIKLIKQGMDTAAILRRFRIERQILAHLDHPNIAKLLDAGTTDDGSSYFIMDYIEGILIDVYCDAHNLSTVDRLKLFSTVCSSVEYAHQHHIVHRDLKPSNILVTDEGVPKLLDFGIARVLDPELAAQTVEFTAAAMRPLTPKYASPEQIRGEPVTAAGDVYSLGVLLYELLTGHPPYRLHGHTPQEIERIICEEEPERPSTVIGRVEEVSTTNASERVTLTPESVSKTRDGRPEQLRRRLAGDLDMIVLMAMRKEPELRYSSVAQFSADIGRYLDGLPVIARKNILWYRAWKFIQRNKVRIPTAALILFVAIGVYLLTWKEKVGNTAIDSIAVLPLVNASGDPNTEYLSDGISESLINTLSQLPKLRVVPRSVVFRYKNREVDPKTVGQDLGVRAVLTGRLVQRGDTLNIQTELIDVKNVSQLWGQQYKKNVSDLFTVQEEISKDISEGLRLKLSGEEKKRLTKRYTENVDAYALYLRGRYHWNKRVEEGFRKGIDYFQQAIEKDPTYALAYAGLADCYALLAQYNLLPPKDSFLRAKAAVTRALQLDDTLAEAHTSLAFVRMHYDWDFLGAAKEFQRAIELNPNYATAHQWYALYLARMGKMDEAIAEIKRAQALDPLSPVMNANVAWVFYFARQYDQAIEQCRKMIEMDAQFALTHSRLGQAYEEKKMYKEAIAEFQKAITIRGDSPITVSMLGHAYAISGNRAEAQKRLDELKELSKRRYVPPFAIALIYVGLGEKDQAFEWLEKAYEERSDGLVSLKVDPRLDSLRSDARFSDLVRRIGLSP